MGNLRAKTIVLGSLSFSSATLLFVFSLDRCGRKNTTPADCYLLKGQVKDFPDLPGSFAYKSAVGGVLRH